mgnify:CR=1 FL=1
MRFIRRAKALALVLEGAKVIDADGNDVDLTALDAEMNRAQANLDALDLSAVGAEDHEGHNHP